jgi:hypothetical protein
MSGASLMIYDDYFWTELAYESHAYVAPNGEIIARVRYNTPEKTYSYEDREFMTLDAAKTFTRACLIRAGKIEETDDE